MFLDVTLLAAFDLSIKNAFAATIKEPTVTPMLTAETIEKRALY